jgi:hypothetical protein
MNALATQRFYVYVLKLAGGRYYVGKGCGERVHVSAATKPTIEWRFAGTRMTQDQALQLEETLISWCHTQGIPLANLRQSGRTLTRTEAKALASGPRPASSRAMKREAKRRRKDPITRALMDQGSRNWATRRAAAAEGLGLPYRKVGSPEVRAWEARSLRAFLNAHSDRVSIKESNGPSEYK